MAVAFKLTTALVAFSGLHKTKPSNMVSWMEGSAHGARHLPGERGQKLAFDGCQSGRIIVVSDVGTSELTMP